MDEHIRVVHFGPVAIGGIASMGEESLMGGEVNLIFRLEKLASSLGEPLRAERSSSHKAGRSGSGTFARRIRVERF
jgi:hypothetical protein